jgi:hypothetical protein
MHGLGTSTADLRLRWRTEFFQLAVWFAALLIATPMDAVANYTFGHPATAVAKRETVLALATQVELDRLARDSSEPHRTSIPLSEYRSFSGIGTVVCSVDGLQRAATAFLVGAFDIAVTVAHVFEIHGRMALAQECKYLVSGPLGQIRERIAVAKIHSQWRSELTTFGRPDDDLAVIRLRSPTRGPQRTLSLTRFTSTGAPVALIGFSPEFGTDPQQRRLRGRVYLRPQSSCVKFSHDINPRWVSPGAPLIDPRDGVVIGIHNYLPEPTANADIGCKDRGNAMLLMNDWLARTLRAEIAAK